MSFTILTDNDKKITQPKSILIDLMNHQKTMIYKMLEIELTGKIIVPNYSMKKYTNMIGVSGDVAEINTNIGILGDKVGSGKTLMIITLLTIKKLIEARPVELGGTQFYSVKLQPSSSLIKTNLIIVPHKILPQWKDAFAKYSPSLRVYTIGLNKDIDKIIKIKKELKKNWQNNDVTYETEEIVPEKVEQYDVILIGETMYKRFYKTCSEFRFNRIMIDEADTIKLPREMSCQFNFLWLITGTPKGLFYSNKSFISKIFKEDNLNLNSNFVIKNDDAFIEQSIKLPHPKRFKIKCITPRELDIIKDLIPPSVLQMINAGNSEQAIRALNCNVDTNDNILQVITKNLVDSIENKKIELEAEKKKHYSQYMMKEKEQKIKFIEGQIEKLTNKYEDIKKRIYQLNDTNCPVCMGEFTNPVMVSCCNNTFCFDCLAVSMGELKNNKCPYCQQHISKQQIHVFQTDNLEGAGTKVSIPTSNSNKYELKDKFDVLIDLVQNKPNGSFMIFAGYMDTFHKIETKLKALQIPYHILKGQSSVVKRHIDDFKDKKVRILMLNAQFFGAGMNLQMASDIIMFHRFTKEMEEQIIGRAQRLGRSITEPLNVHYLLHDNESDEIENNFKFEDQTGVHYMDWLEQEKDAQIQKLNNSGNSGKIIIEEEKIYTIEGADNSDIEKYDFSSDSPAQNLPKSNLSPIHNDKNNEFESIHAMHELEYDFKPDLEPDLEPDSKPDLDPIPKLAINPIRVVHELEYDLKPDKKIMINVSSKKNVSNTSDNMDILNADDIINNFLGKHILEPTSNKSTNVFIKTQSNNASSNFDDNFDDNFDNDINLDQFEIIE